MAIKRTRNSGLTVPALVKPTPGKSTDSWGLLLNSNIDKQAEFYTKLVQDSETQNQEIRRIDTEKVSTSDVPTIVEPVVVQVVEDTGKPMLDNYMEETIKPSIDTYTSGKKAELDNYVNLTSKPSLDSYEKEKEKELNTYTTTKKSELDSHTTAKKGELDAYEKTKETQLNNYTGTKQTQLDSYTNTKKGELDSHATVKKGQLDTYTTAKRGELDTHTGKKKSELDAYEKTKEGELNTFTSAKKTEITNHTNTKKGELDTYTTQKKREITTHTDSEIERVNADSELANKANKTVQVIAGNGLVGGGDLSTNRTLNIVSADDGITVNADNIKLNIVDNATTNSATRAGSARQIKLLSENKVNKTDIVDDLTTADKSKVLSANMGKYLEGNKQNKTDSKLGTTDKNIVGAINESLWHILAKSMSNSYTKISDEKDLGDFWSHENFTPTDIPKTIDYHDDRSKFFHLKNMSFHNNAKGFNMLQEVTTVDGVRFIRSIGWTGEPTPWRETLTDKSKLFTGQLGVNSIIYIQDTGAKTRGNGYIDKTTGKLYRCINTTTDTAVTTNFELATNIDNSSRLALIEERLGIYSPVGKIQSISVSRNEDSSSPILTYSSV